MTLNNVAFSTDLRAPVEFEYDNWRGNNHKYVVMIESIKFERTPVGPPGSSEHQEMFALHGWVITRDGDSRPDMGPTRRRTFILQKIKNFRVLGRTV